MAEPSFDDLYDLGRAQFLLSRPDLFLAPGDVTDVIVNMAAAMADKNIEFAVESLRKTFLDSSFEDDLTTLVDDRYSLQRDPATASQVTVELTRPVGPSPGTEPAGSLAAGFRVSTEPDANGQRIEFTLDSPLSWILGETGTKSVLATSTTTGSATRAIAGTITNLVDAPFDGTITVTNPANAAGGNDEQSDVSLREEARTFRQTQARATEAAIEFAALTVPSVRIATAVEDEAFNATVFVADQNGESTAQMVLDVIAALAGFRALGVPVTVVGGQRLEQNIDYTLVTSEGADPTLLEPAIAASLQERIERLPVSDGTATGPGVLSIQLLESAILCVDIDRITRVVINNPTADVVAPAGTIVKPGTITRT